MTSKDTFVTGKTAVLPNREPHVKERKTEQLRLSDKYIWVKGPKGGYT